MAEVWEASITIEVMAWVSPFGPGLSTAERLMEDTAPILTAGLTIHLFRGKPAPLLFEESARILPTTLQSMDLATVPSSPETFLLGQEGESCAPGGASRTMAGHSIRPEQNSWSA